MNQGLDYTIKPSLPAFSHQERFGLHNIIKEKTHPNTNSCLSQESEQLAQSQFRFGLHNTCKENMSCYKFLSHTQMTTTPSIRIWITQHSQGKYMPQYKFFQEIAFNEKNQTYLQSLMPIRLPS